MVTFYQKISSIHTLKGEEMKIKVVTIIFVLILLFSCSNSMKTSVDVQKDTLYPAISKEVNYRNLIEINLTEWENIPYHYESIFWSENYEKGNSTLSIRGSYPIWKGFRNKSFQKEVNLAILGAIKSFQGYDERPAMHSIDSTRDEFMRSSDLYLNNLCEDVDLIPDLRLATFFSYSISLLTPDFISIIFFCYYIIGTAGTYETAFTMNIDVKNEKIMHQPSELFSTTDYWDSLRLLFLDRLKTQHPPIQSAKIDAEWLTWESIWQYISFAFTPSHFLIIYNENETYSMEKRYIVPIPYNEVIHLLKKDFVNLPQWKEAYSSTTTIKDWSSFSFYEDNSQVFGYGVKYPNDYSACSDQEKGHIIITVPNDEAKITIQYNPAKSSLEKKYSDVIRFLGYSYEVTEVPEEHYIVLSPRERKVFIRIEYTDSLSESTMSEINKILSTIRLF